MENTQQQSEYLLHVFASNQSKPPPTQLRNLSGRCIKNERYR